MNYNLFEKKHEKKLLLLGTNQLYLCVAERLPQRDVVCEQEAVLRQRGGGALLGGTRQEALGALQG